MIGLITGPLWARKAWGVWWQWDAALTSALVLELIFVAYLLLRKYGGPGSEKLSAVVAIFGMANVPFVYWSVNIWRTVHPTTNVVPTLQPSMGVPFLWCSLAFVGLYVLMLAARARLENRRAELDALYLVHRGLTMMNDHGDETGRWSNAERSRRTGWPLVELCA